MITSGKKLLAAVAAMALTVSSCGLLGGESDSGSSGPLGKSKIKVGIIPELGAAGFYLALDRGYFKEQGLDVDVVTVNSGKAAVDSISNGSTDIAVGSYPAVLLAQANKAGDYKIVGDGFSAKPNVQVLLASPKSPVKTAQDVPGRRLATTATKTFADLCVLEALKAKNVPTDKVTWHPIPFSDMAAAMDRGDVDAVSIVEPQLTQALRTYGGHKVADCGEGPLADMPVTGYFAVGGEGKFAQSNPKTVAAFQRGLFKGHAEAADRSKVEPIFVKYLKLDDVTAKLVTVAGWSTSIEKTRIQRVATMMQNFGVLKEPLDVGPMIFRPEVDAK
ncbi:NitT/TauT family transport system substrate-binding protein [Herbihabitans rhizosphaerae]|uniref:NitT/TauT family transport system substrate-binding protein n=1 Tax=Herbihabitans rhizosphaerae TaxID=1872711 RepID=A0A4Q7KWL4_9PSEU|nr:ABC transporter substrate-binding protein [Herbihabitans rhizosphaerae]RZS41057.1 NitT/TauT family transport system substrate-binding protein [Herbihabitans rhizosphaerae]